MSILLQAATTTILDTTQSAMQIAAPVADQMNVLELLTKGGFMMIPLMIALVVAVFFIIERYFRITNLIS